MDIINKINNYYALSIKEDLNSGEFQQFKNILFDYVGHDNPLALKPYFIAQSKRNEFLRITEILINLFEKLTFAYFNNSEIRNILSINGRVKDYIVVNPGYSRKHLVVRLDAYYDISKDSLSLLEINTDNPSYIGMNDLFIKTFDQLPSLKILRQKFNVKSDTMVALLYEVLIKKYKEYCSNFKKLEQKDPHIVIVCSRNSFIRNDVDLIVKFLKEKNFNVSYADPRDFDYDGKVLKLNGETVDIVYRDTLKDFFRTESSGKIHSNLRNKILSYSKKACLQNGFINRHLKKGYFGHAEDVLQAYSDNNICIINPFSSTICAQKLTFALIQDDLFSHLFNEEELDTIKKYIPWTKVLGEYKTNFDNKQVDLINFVKKNRKQFVLKPNGGHGGKGILIGCEINQKLWERKIDEVIKSGLKYIVQEFTDIPTENFPAFSNGTFEDSSQQYFNINFWGIDGKFAGSFVRASEKKVINVSQGGRYVPLYYVLNY
jgi:hypothetical protein